VKRNITVRRSSRDPRRSKTDWSRVANLSEPEIIERAKSDPDARLTDAEFWKDVCVVMPERKIAISLRVDRETLAWFKEQGGRYQAHMIAVLKAYVQAHRKGRLTSLRDRRTVRDKCS
jgi:uncharacterized protein (DUF4415 family)